MYYFPRVDRELLENTMRVLLRCPPCLGGEIGDALKNNQYDQARQIAEWYKSGLWRPLLFRNSGITATPTPVA